MARRLGGGECERDDIAALLHHQRQRHIWSLQDGIVEDEELISSIIEPPDSFLSRGWESRPKQ